MANGRQKMSRVDTGRDAGGFLALPWSVLDSSAFQSLSHPARSLLLEIARQFVKDNNGKLLCSKKYLERRRWKSQDVITRAKKELLAARLIYETVMGHRPNKASWYAVTWHRLDRSAQYDTGAELGFRQGAYKSAEVLVAKPSKQDLYDRHRATPAKNAALSLPRGAGDMTIAPAHGLGTRTVEPSRGAIGMDLGVRIAPFHGDHLEIPSAVALSLRAAGQGTMTAVLEVAIH